MAREESDLENLEFPRNKRPEDGLLSVFFHFSSIVGALSLFFSIFSQLWGHFYRFFLFFLNYRGTLAVFFYFSSIVGSLLSFSICFLSYGDAGKLWRDDGLQAGGHYTQLPPLRDLPT